MQYGESGEAEHVAYEGHVWVSDLLFPKQVNLVKLPNFFLALVSP